MASIAQEGSSFRHGGRHHDLVISTCTLMGYATRLQGYFRVIVCALNWFNYQTKSAPRVIFKSHKKYEKKLISTAISRMCTRTNKSKIYRMESRERGRGAGTKPPMAATPPLGQGRPKTLLHPAPPTTPPSPAPLLEPLPPAPPP